MTWNNQLHRVSVFSQGSSTTYTAELMLGVAEGPLQAMIASIMQTQHI